MMRALRGIVAVCLLSAACAGAAVLFVDASPVQAAPPCEVQCRIDYRQCQRICGQPDIQCLVACETILDTCLANCGAIIQ